MEQIERETAIDSLTHLESYYQSRYEYYLAMATEAKEHRERVGLLLLDLGRDVSYSDHLTESKRATRAFEDATFEEAANVDGRPNNGSLERLPSDNGQASSLLPSTERTTHSPDRGDSGVSSSKLYKNSELELDLVVDEESSTQLKPEQIKGFLIDLAKAMSVIESVSNLDSGKTLHQNYLKKILSTELEKELSIELAELYLDEAITRGYLELDEFDNKCYIAKSRNNIAGFAVVKQSDDVATETVLNLEKTPDLSSNRKPYNLPPSSKLKPKLLDTIEQYIKKCSPKRFSIEDVINYLYPQKQQLKWSQAKKNKVRSCISNVLGRKVYLGKHWSRIRPGVYRPLI